VEENLPFRKLPDSYKAHGREMQLIERNDNIGYVVYSDGRCFELFKIRVGKQSTIIMGGNKIVVPERELVPTDNNFGEWAWYCSTKDRVNHIIENKILKDEIG